MRLALVALDQDQVGRREARQDFGQRRFFLLAHDRVTMPADQRHLGRTGGAVAKGVGAGSIDVGVVMSMLDRCDPPAAPHELGDQPLDQGRLAGILPADDAEHAAIVHAAIRPALA